MVSSAYLRLLIISPLSLDSSLCFTSLAFHMIYSACKLNKQGDNIQPQRTPFPVLNQSVVPYQVLNFASWPVHSFLRRQVKWSGIPISLIIFHSLFDPHKDTSIVNKADVFLEFPCFLSYPTNVGKLISGSYAFSKPSLYIWKFHFTYYWSLACWILSITLVACEKSATVRVGP